MGSKGPTGLHGPITSSGACFAGRYSPTYRSPEPMARRCMPNPSVSWHHLLLTLFTLKLWNTKLRRLIFEGINDVGGWARRFDAFGYELISVAHKYIWWWKNAGMGHYIMSGGEICGRRNEGQSCRIRWSDITRLTSISYLFISPSVKENLARFVMHLLHNSIFTISISA